MMRRHLGLIAVGALAMALSSASAAMSPIRRIVTEPVTRRARPLPRARQHVAARSAFVAPPAFIAAPAAAAVGVAPAPPRPVFPVPLLAPAVAGTISGPQLLPADVGAAISRVVQEAQARHVVATIAVVDRGGAVLAVYVMAGAAKATFAAGLGTSGAQLVGTPLPATGEAISKAITGAYLSTSAGNAFSTRTASQIVQDHFNPGTAYAPAGPLYGVQFSSLPCSDLVVRLSPTDLSSATRGPHRAPLGLAADPGGFPLYKGGALVGGIGVKAAGTYGYDTNIHNTDLDTDELLALAGTVGLDAPASLRADQISVGGLLLRYSDATTANLLTNPATAPAYATLPADLADVPGYYAQASGLGTGSVYGSIASGLMQSTSGGINAGTPPYLLVDGAGHVRYPPTAGAGPAALTANEVTVLLQNAYAQALQTRAQIRNSVGAHAAVTISVVDAYGTILGIASTQDAPMFGIDVSLQKARSAAFLSSTGADAALRGTTDSAITGYANAANTDFGRTVFATGYAWSERAIGNIARDTLPDGTNGAPNGPLSLPANQTTPFSDGLQLELVINNLVTHVGYLKGGAGDTPAICTPLAKVGPASRPVLANGLQVFPGGFPIYRGATLVGGIGVSGDGVDQDDLISFLGLYNAGAALGSGIGHAAAASRASVLSADGVQPKYVNCPFAPYVNSSAQDVCSGK